MNMPTSGQVAAFGRHAATAGASVVGTLVAVNLLSSTDGQHAISALDNISSGIKQIMLGLTTLIPIVSGLYAAITASPLWQMLAVAKNPVVAQILTTTPEAANAVPSNKVVPQ